jgi:hypothetical protein
MAELRWTKDDIRPMAQLGVVLVAAGVGYGLRSGHGLIFGVIAGLLFFGFVIAIGSLAVLFRQEER